MSPEEAHMFAFLTEHIGNWVDARELANRSCSYARVIKQLRERHNLPIENKVERGIRHERKLYVHSAMCKESIVLRERI